MASMEADYGDSQSPEVQPTSLAAVPSSPSTAPPVARPPVNDAPRAKITRTYGRKVVDAPVDAIEPTEAQLPGIALALHRHSTVVIPDSEPAPLHARSPQPSSESDDGDRTIRRERALATSSPTRRDVQSTDPTSEDEEPVRLTAVRKKPATAMDVDSDGESSAGDASDDETGALAFLKRRPALEDLLADVDRDFDSRPENPTPVANIPTSSSLPPLTITNESGASRPASSSRQRAASPSSPSRELDDIEALLGSAQTADSEDVVPTARSRARKSRAIVDSEDEDEEEGAPLPSRVRQHSAPVRASSGDEAGRPAPSKRERVRELWQKKVDANDAKERKRRMDLAASRGEECVEPISAPVEDDFIIEEDSEERSAKKAAKARKPAERKMKSLNKKEVDEMNRMTAALNRQQDPRLVATRKVGLSVADALKQHNISSLPAPPVERTASTYAPPAIITLSSSSDAIVTSSPAHSVAQTPLPKLSLKALGKQRATSPIADGDQDTPVPHRVRKPLAPAGWPERKKAATPVDDDDDDELLAPDEMVRRDQEKREKARRAQELQEKKRAALAAAKVAAAQAAQGDSDSDIEIEMPGAPSKASHASSSKDKDTLAAFVRTPARPRNDPRKILARNAGIDLAHPPSDDALPSESQLDAAGHEFGRHLDTKYHENLTSVRKHRSTDKPSTSSSRAKKPSRPVEITHEKLNDALSDRIQQQFFNERTKKQTNARKQKDLATQGEQQELQSVDVNALMKTKREKEGQDDQQDEDEDGDYVDDDEEEEAYGSGDAGSEEDEAGSATGELAPATIARADQEDDGDVDSEGEPIMPRSSQNSDRLRHAADDAADDEDEEMPPPAMTRRLASKTRIIADDDDVEASSTVTPAPTELAPIEVAQTATDDSHAAAPAKVAFGLLGDVDGDAGGFSQFFDSQFSQAASDDGQAEGFLRPANDDFAAPAPTLFAAQPLISTAERAADAARLEARGGFNDFEPSTPRELPAPRQYLNEKGFLTQTRPANLFDSPSDSPAYYRNSLSTRDSQSQALDETQVASAQTPTQVSKDPTRLRRAGALTSFDSLDPIAEAEHLPDPTELAFPRNRAMETQLEETQLEDAQLAEETQDTQDALPSAAQPTAPRNAFDALTAGAAQFAAPMQAQQVPRRRARNAFVDAEANLSDEEVGLGLGGVSGDEDEDGHDAELESLVDNEEVDRDVQAEQDKLARDRYQEDQEKAEAEAMKRAQRVVDGKERQKRGAYDLSDDDFDDEYVSRNGHREKKARVESLTIGQLKDNEETQAFGNVLAQGFVATSKEGEYAFLETQHALSEDEDGDADIEADLDESDVFGRLDAPDLRVRTFREAQELAVQQARAKRALEEDEDVEMLGREEELLDERVLRDLSPQINLGMSSSPAAPIKLNLKHRAVAATTTVVQATHVDEYADLDSQISIFGVQHGATVKYSERDESSITTATVNGGRSAVTSFKRTTATTATAASKPGAKGKAGPALGAKPSKLAAVRKGGFA